MPRRRHGTANVLPVFGLSGRDGVPSVRDCGFKAHNLIRMAAMGLPVPDGFVLGTAWCKAINAGGTMQSRLNEVLRTSIGGLERQTGLAFGGARRPLLVSVRSGAPVSMPGMMDTVLNVGLNETSLSGLLRLTGDHRLVWDSYSRLILAFAEIVAGISPRPFERELDAALRRAGVSASRQLDFRSLRNLAGTFLELYRDHTGSEFPQDPMEQLTLAARAVFASWMSEKALAYRRLNAVPDEIGTAVTVQRMVFGNSGGNSGAGVGFTRDPASGENRPYIDWLAQAQGEDIVSGRRRVGLEEGMPAWLVQKLGKVGEVLERSFRDAQEYEFTVENGELFMLQTRTAKRSALASLRIAVDQVDSGLITPEEALSRISAIDVDTLEIRKVESASPPIGHATAAGNGVAQGPAVFSVDAARDYAKRGTPPILVRPEIATRDIDGIAVASGVLTAAGGRTSHAAVVARQMGKVCLVGCEDLFIDDDAKQARIGEEVLAEGAALCLDGNTGAVYTGSPIITSERPLELIDHIERWRAQVREASSAVEEPHGG